MKKFLALSAILLVTGLFTVHEIYAGSAKKPASSQSSAMSEEKAENSALSGKVVETMNSGGYTYILLEKNGK